MSEAIDIRSVMLRAGVTLADDPPPPTEDETLAADALGLTPVEVRFARRHGVTPERYAASKNIHNLATFEAEMARRREEEKADR